MTTLMLKGIRRQDTFDHSPDLDADIEELQEEYPAIVNDPDLWGGDATVRGTRIPVFMIEDLYRESCNLGEIIECYPRLTPADVLDALSYARQYSDRVAQERATHEKAIAEALG